MERTKLTLESLEIDTFELDPSHLMAIRPEEFNCTGCDSGCGILGEP